MKKGTKLALSITMVLVILAVFKPSKDSFNDFVKEKYEKIDSKDSWNEIAKKSVANLGNSLINAQSQLTVEYKDKIFFALASRYRIDYQEEYLGIFGFWMKIK